MPAIWGAVIAGAGSLIGGAMQSNAASSAAGQQVGASNRALSESARQFDITRADYAPYQQVGSAAIYRLGELLGLNVPRGTAGLSAPNRADFYRTVTGPQMVRVGWDPQHEGEWIQQQGSTSQFDSGAYNEALRQYNAALNAPSSPGLTPESIMAMDPGYQFRLSEGEKAINRASNAAGNRYSGATLKDLLRYGQDYASGEFGNIYNRLAGVAGTGQAATQGLGALSQNYANNQANLITGAGNASAAGTIGSANAIGSGISGAGNAVQQYLLLRNLMGNSGGNFSSGARANMNAYDLMANV